MNGNNSKSCRISITLKLKVTKLEQLVYYGCSIYNVCINLYNLAIIILVLEIKLVEYDLKLCEFF